MAALGLHLTLLVAELLTPVVVAGPMDMDRFPVLEALVVVELGIRHLRLQT
jgi:hypothetical protein